MKNFSNEKLIENLHETLSKSSLSIDKIISLEQLTTGNSRNTYKVRVKTRNKEIFIALRLNHNSKNQFESPEYHLKPSEEAKVIQAVKEAGVPTPKIMHVFNKSDGLGEGYLMNWISGETIGGKISRSKKFAKIRKRLASQCGEYLGKIHKVDLKKHELEKIVPKKNPEKFIRILLNYCHKMNIHLPVIDYTAQWLLENPAEHRKTSLVHNDFRNGNLIISPKTGIKAVIDWEIAHLGNPIRDLGWLCTKSWRYGVPQKEVGGFGTLRQLLDSYKMVTEYRITPEELRYWMVFGSFWWAIGCLSVSGLLSKSSSADIEKIAISRRVTECELDCATYLFTGKSKMAHIHRQAQKPLNKKNSILNSIESFINCNLTEATDTRRRYTTKIALNCLQIAKRERLYQREFEDNEYNRLRRLLNKTDSLENLRKILCSKIREGEISINDKLLKNHLLETSFGNSIINQPEYPSIKKFL